MPVYHAYSNSAYIGEGTVLLVTGGSERVKIAKGDVLSIETPQYNRVTATVVDRDGERMRLLCIDGPSLLLKLSPDNSGFRDFKISDHFSRQYWGVLRSGS